MSEAEMRRFWDERAAENAFFYVDNRIRTREDEDAFWAGGERAVDALLAAVGATIDPGDSIVEIGCGVGRLTRVLAARGADVRALDVSGRMLGLAREHNPGLDSVEWILGDGVSLSGIEDRSADVCFSLVVFQHIPEPEITLGYVREMGRVLRPGGWSAFQFSNLETVHRRRPLRERARARLRSAVGRGPRGQSHPAWLGSSIRLDQLGEAAHRAGLEVERTANEGSQWCVALLRAPAGPGA